MTVTHTPSSIGHMLWTGKWIIMLCALACVAVAAAVLTLSDRLYQTQIRIQMSGQYSSPEMRRSIYDDFVRWRSRVMPPPSAPKGVAITEGYNPIAESATLVLTLPEDSIPFAMAYYEGLDRSLASFSAAKITESQHKLQLLTGLGGTLPVQGSDYVASLATDLTFLIEDTKDSGGLATITPPTPAQPIGPSIISSLVFALITGAGTGIVFLISRSIWRGHTNQNNKPPAPQTSQASTL